jgi:serine protease inhibitor
MVLASIILVCLTANLCLAANVANTQQRVPPATPVPQIPAIDKTTQVPPPDADYWDNDDFVPFQSNRHDEFDWRLTKALMLSDPSNMILSPFSVKLLLSLLSEAAGPDTSTHKELAAVLPSIQTIIQARELYGKIFGSLLEKSPNYELQIGTKIYVDKSINPRQRYAAIMESYYFTKVEKIEFSKADEAAKTINDWCANITQNHIKELVKKDDVEESVIIMLNALYFNGYWRRPFPVNETVQQPFYVTPTQQVKTWFMGVTDTFYYMESQPLNAKILRLPYKGRKFSMTIILPNAKGGLDDMSHWARCNEELSN